LRSMEAANATPEQFGLKVRSHPDTLIVTARNKMGSGERMTVSIGLANKFVETATLKNDAHSLMVNRKAAENLSGELKVVGRPISGAEQVPSGWLLSKVPVDPVLRFLSEFRNHPGSMLTEPAPIRRYIEERRETELAFWDVLFAAVREADERTLKSTLIGREILCQRRSEGKPPIAGTLRVTNKQRVASRGVEKTGLTEDQVGRAETAYRNNLENKANGNTRPNYPDRIYRAERERPLLIVHLLAIGEQNADLSGNEPLVAWSISFPTTLMKEALVEYVVNFTWLRENYPDDLDETEMQGDE
jgi:hypothetical protein